ncbi:hypothetical protein [Streptomyces chrestomyceticus]|uniref:hypothetical protein n=1 Tax=Streptomyces chrestomyceticus TaxID=68185 RepID=UPI00340CBEB4
MNETIECRAERRGRVWTTRVPEYGVYGHGRTLKALRQNVEEALALVDVTVEVAVIPTTPELEKLEAARNAFTGAQEEAVRALGLRRTTLRDIASAAGVSVKRVKQILAENRTEPADCTDAPAPEATGDAEESQRGEEASCGPQTST